MLGFDDGGARGGVAGYEVREAGEAGGELGFVAGAGVGHGCSCLLAFFSLFLLFLFGEVGWFAVCYGGMLERLPLLQVCSVVGRGDCLRKYSVQRSLSFLSGGDDWPK